MRMRSFLLAVLLIGLMGGVARAEMSGRQIMDEQKTRHEVDSEYVEVVMLLADNKGNKEKRLTKQYNKKLGNGEARALLVFLDPADIKGTALLTWDHDKDPSDQWLYLPAQGKMQRIAEGSKKSYFMGTDFTYEDLEPEDMDNYVYTVVKSEALDGAACWVVEAVPANEAKKRESSYSKRLLWIRQDNYVTVKVEFYDRRERVMKTQTAHDLENVQGTVWRARKTLMDNVSKDHKTVMGLKARELNKPIDDQVFTERFILKGSHLE